MWNPFTKKSHRDNQDETKLNEGGIDLSHQAIGNFTCSHCGSLNINPRMMDIDEDDDSKGSLIKCNSTVCNGTYQKWT